MHYIGVDHHKQYSYLTVLAEDGRRVKEGRVWNIRSEVKKFLEVAGEDSEAVIEAGRSTYTMVEVLEELGLVVKIAHPRGVKMIAHAQIKTDKRDSEVLAQLLRMGMIPEVYQRDKGNREGQRVLRQRAFYVACRTKVKNRIRWLLAQQREEVGCEAERFSNIFSREGRKFLKALDLPGKDKELMAALLKTYNHLEDRIQESDELVKRLYEEMREAQLIDSVPGFATFMSVLVAVEIGDLQRFRKVGNLYSYAGVVPSTHSSGGKNYHGQMVKARNRWLCWALVEAVHPALKADHDLRVFYDRIRRRKGHNTAKVATARRLLTIIYKILKEKRPYVFYKR